MHRAPRICTEKGTHADARHVKQGQHYTVVALCKSCHQGPLMGLHGQRRMWAIKKMDEVDALAVTVRRLFPSTTLSRCQK